MTGPGQVDRRSGLTLAELMIALIIGGMTLVITAQAASNVRLWTDRLGQAETKNTKAVGLYQFMENTLSSILPISRKTDDKPQVLFEGSADSVRFVRVEPGYPSRAGIYQYHLFNRKSADGLWSLILEREILTKLTQFGEPEAPARLVLFNDTEAANFSYAGASGWQTDWIDKEAPPILVKFDIAGWPAMIIALPQTGGKTEVKSGDDDKPDNNKGKAPATTKRVEARQ